MSSSSSPLSSPLSAVSSSASPSPALTFGPFTIPSSHVFYSSSHSSAFVNLRPILPGHVLVVPTRRAGSSSSSSSSSSSPVVRLSDLSEAEHADLWSTVRLVSSLVSSSIPGCTALNIAVQDGLHAGQSVPHVHVHVLPRVGGDFAVNDVVYEKLEEWGPWMQGREEEKERQKGQMKLAAEGDRKNRSSEDMANEAERYRGMMTSKPNNPL